MRYTKEHSKKTRRDILDAASRGFRRDGAVGATVDQLAKDAGATSGALYRQFDSKDALFTEVVSEGMERLVSLLKKQQRRKSDQWINNLISEYLGKHRIDNVSGGCVLPALTTDISRMGGQSQQEFCNGLERALKVMSAPGFGDEIDREEAMLLLASMVGSVILARGTGMESTRQTLKRALCKKFTDDN